MEPDTPDRLPDPPTESSPAAEAPRLGILHLMVLTACVALYLGTLRGLAPAGGSEAMQIDEGTIEGVNGITAGAALAGLVLLVARRRRGMPFPIHPGEFLIVMLGVGAALDLLCFMAYPWLVQSGAGRPHGQSILIGWVALGDVVGVHLIHFALWIWAFVRLKIPRWRFFLLLIAVCYVLTDPLLGFHVVSRMGFRAVMPMFLFSLASPVLIAVVLGIVVLRDHIKGLRYPWTHWFGVALYFWRVTAMNISIVIMWLTQP